MTKIKRVHAFGREMVSFFNKEGELFEDREVVVLESDEEFIAKLPEIEALVGHRMPRGHWAGASRLRLVQLPGAGVDSLLPAPDLSEAVQVCNASGSHEPEMPEFVLALLHALVYRIPTLVDRQRSKEWKLIVATAPLQGRTVCVVGLGTIGQSVARRCATLGMTVVGVRNSGLPVAGVDKVVTPERRLEVLSDADAVVVITPLTEATRGLVGSEELSVLAKGAVLVDVSRGGVMDADALVDTLANGPLEAAAVDVFDTEPLPVDSPLWTTPNLLVTPHTAGWSRHYADRILDVTLANIEAVERGETPPTLVDRQLGY